MWWTREHVYQQALKDCQDGLQASWESEGEPWQNAALAGAWQTRNPGTGNEHNPFFGEASEAARSLAAKCLDEIAGLTSFV